MVILPKAHRLMLTAIVAFGVGVSQAVAAPASCAEHYLQGKMPQVPNAKLAKHTTEICFDGFGVVYSGQTKTPLWSAYHLTPQRIQQAKKVKRVNRFSSYKELPQAWRAELNDYKATGLDRGHLAPFAVMKNKSQARDSFYLTNIVPQHANFNRNEWAAIETRVRDYAKTDAVYVITGALFLNEQLERINRRVLAPSHMYKLVYSPKKNQGIVFVATNQQKTHVRMLDFYEFERFSKNTVQLPVELKQNTQPLGLRYEP